MRIEKVVVEVLRIPVAAAYVAAGRQVDGNWHVLARVTTSDGVEGVGYIAQPFGEMIGAIAAATRELAAAIVGMSVTEPEAVWQRLASRGDWVGPGGLLHWAIAPLDIAVWDAAGRLAGQPLWRLLGGATDTVAAYASDRMWYSLSPEDLRRSVRGHAEAGYGGVKLRLSHTAPPEEQAARVRLARDAGGPGMSVMVDATQGWNEVQALQIGRALQAAGAAWLEDPLHHENLAGLARLAAALDMPIAGGENCYTLAQFRACFEARALDIVILDLARVGGITPWRKIAALAEAYRVPVCGHVIPEVHVHLLASTPMGYLVEYMPRSNELFRNALPPQGGVMRPLAEPGHGLQLDEAAVSRYRVT